MALEDDKLFTPQDILNYEGGRKTDIGAEHEKRLEHYEQVKKTIQTPLEELQAQQAQLANIVISTEAVIAEIGKMEFKTSLANEGSFGPETETMVQNAQDVEQASQEAQAQLEDGARLEEQIQNLTAVMDAIYVEEQSEMAGE